jgi:hypothetical protein
LELYLSENKFWFPDSSHCHCLNGSAEVRLSQGDSASAPLFPHLSIMISSGEMSLRKEMTRRTKFSSFLNLSLWGESQKWFSFLFLRWSSIYFKGFNYDMILNHHLLLVFCAKAFTNIFHSQTVINVVNVIN